MYPAYKKERRAHFIPFHFTFSFRSSYYWQFNWFKWVRMLTFQSIHHHPHPKNIWGTDRMKPEFGAFFNQTRILFFLWELNTLEPVNGREQMFWIPSPRWMNLCTWTMVSICGNPGVGKLIFNNTPTNDGTGKVRPIWVGQSDSKARTPTQLAKSNQIHKASNNHRESRNERSFSLCPRSRQER